MRSVSSPKSPIKTRAQQPSQALVFHNPLTRGTQVQCFVSTWTVKLSAHTNISYIYADNLVLTAVTKSKAHRHSWCEQVSNSRIWFKSLVGDFCVWGVCVISVIMALRPPASYAAFELNRPAAQSIEYRSTWAFILDDEIAMSCKTLRAWGPRNDLPPSPGPEGHVALRHWHMMMKSHESFHSADEFHRDGITDEKERLITIPRVTLYTAGQFAHSPAT